MSVSNVNTNFSKIYSGKLTIPLLFDILIATSPSLYHSILLDQNIYVNSGENTNFWLFDNYQRLVLMPWNLILIVGHWTVHKNVVVLKLTPMKKK